MAATQEYLQQNSLGSLVTAFGSTILIKKHPTISSLVLLKYKQSSGKHFKHQVMREVRGLILDQKQDWKPIVYPYEKFFNYHEAFAPKESEIDWKSVRVTEKADGSLMCLYYYDNQWKLSTTGQPDAGESLHSNQTFYSMFWRVWNQLNLRLPSPEDQSLCFMFELMTNDNRIIVRMEEAGHGEILWLHGVRNMISLEELLPQPFGDKYGWPVVKEHSTRDCLTEKFAGDWSLAKLKRYVSQLPPTKSEGVVVCDKNFTRVKVKSPSYIALTHLNTKGDERINAQKMLQIVKSCEGSEFLAYYPQWTSFYNEVDKIFTTFSKRIDFLVQQRAECPEQKNYSTPEENLALTAAEDYLSQNPGCKHFNSSDFLREPSITLAQLAAWLKLDSKFSNFVSPTLPTVTKKKNPQKSSSSNSKQTSTQSRIAVPSGSFTIEQPSFGKPKKVNPNRVKELEKLDALIDSFIQADEQNTNEDNDCKQKPKKTAKKSKKKKKSKRR